MAYVKVGLWTDESLGSMRQYVSGNVSGRGENDPGPSMVSFLPGKASDRYQTGKPCPYEHPEDRLDGVKSYSTVFMRYPTDVTVYRSYGDTISPSIYASGPRRLLITGRAKDRYNNGSYATADRCTATLSNASTGRDLKDVHQIDPLSLSRVPLEDGTEELTMEVRRFMPLPGETVGEPERLVFRGNRVGQGMSAAENGETWFADTWTGGVVTEPTHKEDQQEDENMGDAGEISDAGTEIWHGQMED